jgi:NosR/NirI family transcriptional regulator, nitrous oxide reductase regulator
MKRGRIGMRKALAYAALSLATAMPLAAHGGAAYYSKPLGIDLSAQTYKDGSYRGTAIGFREGLTVEVTVKGGKVTAVKVIDHNEVNSRFYAYPIQVIPSAIVKKQSTELDAVSGASATSYGIMCAVENALENAK